MDRGSMTNWKIGKCRSGCRGSCRGGCRDEITRESENSIPLGKNSEQKILKKNKPKKNVLPRLDPGVSTPWKTFCQTEPSFS